MSDGTRQGKRPKENRKQRLSDTWIARHKLTLPQEDWFDTVRPELILRISYGGAKTFRVRHKENGKTRTFKLGRWHPETFNVEAARRAAKSFKPAPSISTDGMTEDQVWWLTATFAQVIEKYISEVVINFRTADETKRCYRRYVIPALGKKVFVDLKKTDAGLLRRTMRTENGERQADIIFALIRSIMFWVEDEEVIDGYESPLRYRPKRRGKKKRRGGGRERVLDDHELRMVWRAAEQMGGLYGGLVRLLLLTGQRRQCLATATWSEIVDGTWYIRDEGDDAKGTGQILRLPPLALKILSGLPRIKGNPYVFGVEDKGEHKPFNSFSQRKNELLELLPRPIPRWTLHDLRRTARTRLEDIGVDMQTGEVVIGHALPGVKRTYIRSKFEEKRADALSRLAMHIAEIVGSSPDRGGTPPAVPRTTSSDNVVPIRRTRRA
ncbi:integrase family protein [Bradyrhizobium arachidis]|uniref:tyrosine-type recombinase/integrase n=1 Tax=Bradyrhizobium arachidis TaxID=858423 RepID=UPI00216380FD|nr:integrase family protein [Bradyrhizobium arachidis]UVO28335.1 integrase family protein [Bradyrhizobium arachidis]